MLHLIPAPLHRAGLRLAHAVRRRWWRLARPRLTGVCVVACDDAGRVLGVVGVATRGERTFTADEERVIAARAHDIFR